MMKLHVLYSIFLKSTGVTTDSRNCPEGSIFFALKGDSFDGNKYALSALDKGCFYAVVDDASLASNSRLFLVDDVLQCLQDLALHHRRTLAVPIIGITGSNGKTTTKELLAAVLEQKYNIHYTKGNFNNHIGVPLTLLGLKASHELAIVEMGANHPGEIGELCQIVEPDRGIITNIGKAHLEGFGGIEGVIKTKKELYDAIRLNGEKLYVNAHDDLLINLSEGITRHFYNGQNSMISARVMSIVPSLKLEVCYAKAKDVLSTQLAGEYNLINILAALEIGADYGVEYAQMKQALEAYEPSNNRSQIIEKGSRRIILDAYNANPASMAVAVDNFKKIDAERKVVVLGAMKELGVYSKAEHQELVDRLSASAFDRMIVVGQEFDAIDNKPQCVEFFADLDPVKGILAAELSATFLIKGSRGMKMEQLLDWF